VVVLGLGVDVVDVARFSAALGRTPGLAGRLLVDAEREGRPDRLAARFAAKEALAKALHAPRGLRWHDAWVDHDPDGAPRLVLTGTVAQACAERGVARTHQSLSHDGGVAVAVVLLEG
jgi:holo-[acyl-carrier protein] synthase